MSSSQTDAPVRGQVSGSGSALLLGSLGFFLITLDLLIVNVALSRIGHDLGGGTAALQWVIDGYTLVFAALLLCAGNLADRFGAKRTYIVGIVLFAVTSLACALAPTMGMLVAARCAQGAAAALMLPASMSLIREAFPDPVRRSRALGVWAAGGAVAAAAGPLLGGIFTTFDWRWVFAVNVPVCVVMVALSVRIPRSPRRPTPFDWAGQALAIVGLGSLVYGLIEGGATGFNDPVAIAALIIAPLAIAGFIAVQARGAHPMMPLSLFRTHDMRVALFGGFSFIVGWFGTVFLISLYLQQHLGLSPFLAGLAFLPSAAVSLLGNLGSGPLANRFGPRVPAVIGLASMTVGLIALAVTAAAGNVWLTAALVVLVGAGGSVATPPLTGVVLSSTTPDRAGVASAVSNTLRQVGGALAIAVLGSLISGDFLTGLRISFLIAASIGAASAIAAATIRTRNTPA